MSEPRVVITISTTTQIARIYLYAVLHREWQAIPVPLHDNGRIAYAVGRRDSLLPRVPWGSCPPVARLASATRHWSSRSAGSTRIRLPHGVLAVERKCGFGLASVYFSGRFGAWHYWEKFEGPPEKGLTPHEKRDSKTMDRIAERQPGCREEYSPDVR